MKIRTIEDVHEFFRHLIEDLKLNLHPDNLFSEYVSIETGEPTFTSEECEKLDRMMLECFEICEREGVDIYEIGMELIIR